jgi:uncharacterized linocin/CFP29 family protein
MPNEVYDLKWGQELAGQITSQVKEEVKAIRRVRPLIPMVAGAMTFAKTVDDATITIKGGAVTMNPSAMLAPIKILRPFVVRQELFGDLVSISRLAVNAGYDVAAGEDAVLLFGAQAATAVGGFPATDESGTLANQAGLLSAVPPQPIGVEVDESILAGITTLRARGHFGPYCVVLSPDLYNDAYSPIEGTAIALIEPISHQLREDGVAYSPSLPAKTGVVFSVGKAAIDFVVPWDLHVECRDIQGDATFVVIEQFRLRVNDRNATVNLT